MSLAGSPVYLLVLVIGCLLLLVALLGGAIGGGRMRTANATRARIVIALVGVVLLAAPYLYRASHVAGGPAQSAAAPPPPPPPKPNNPLVVATAAIEKCPLGVAPTIPEAATATREQMLAARKEFQAYDEVTKAYAKCVDDAVEQVGKQFPDASATLQEFAATAHNTAINQEQAVADELNAQVRAYKAKHPAEK
jgi:hypothetical protein